MQKYSDEEIAEVLLSKQGQSAIEMAVSLRHAEDKIEEKAETFFEHFIKVTCYPEDSYNQNKWRNELSTRLSEAGRYKVSSSNKPFEQNVYDKLFTAFASTQEEFISHVELILANLPYDGYEELDASKLDAIALYQTFTDVRKTALSYMTQAKLYTRADYRQLVIDVAIPKCKNYFVE